MFVKINLTTPDIGPQLLQPIETNAYHGNSKVCLLVIY